MMRKIQIVSADLNTKKMLLEDRLEKLLNDPKLSLEDSTDEMVDVLKEIGVINMSMSTWEGYVKEITKENDKGVGSEPETQESLQKTER